MSVSCGKRYAMGRRKADGRGGRIDPDHRYPVGAAALVIGVSPSGFRNLERSGRLTCERTAGGQRRVSGAELLRFLAEEGPDQSREPTRPPVPALSAADRAARQAWLARWMSHGLKALPTEAPPTARLRLRTDIERALRTYDPDAPDPEVSDLVQTLADRARERVEAEQERAECAENKATLIAYGLEALATAMDRLPARLVGAPKSPTRRHLRARLRAQFRDHLEGGLTGEEVLSDIDELIQEFLATWQVEHAPPSRVPASVKVLATGLVGAAGGAAAATLSVPSIRATVKQRMTAFAIDLTERMIRAIKDTPPSSPASPGANPGAGAR